MRTKPNKPPTANPAITPRPQIDRPRRGAAEAERSATRRAMTFTRRLFLYCAFGAAICGVAQGCFLFCFFTYELIGKYIWVPFFWLSSWPNMIVQPFYPKTLPSWLDKLSWPISCFISLVGWVTLSVVVAVIVHGILLLRRRNKL